MKNRASGFLKQIISNLSSMAKSKTMALKSKTNAIRARLLIFSLMKNKKLLMSSLSEKFHSVWGHDSQSKDNDCLLEDGTDQSKAIVLYNNSLSLPNPSGTLVVEEQDQDGYEGYYNYECGDDDDDDDDDKYPDLTHTLFDSEDLDLGGSVIDLVKNSKEEAGKEFKLEDEIDFAADLFIMKFRRQMDLQKQESFNRKREMQKKGA
ncbi:uncharacterized protein HKW66_Vig0045580 [Vigna angularis]|uniref:Uncharacterized protein n=1 Tax=Phaseolus angularis TaxID=3914 RepID=A0A8T0L4N8_PHAAN|nr:uncharacterized protein LOC108328122 [Vigna angularis]KAG2405303.1 uncharacterized protein HKW66_Vig0045580 [Vigna angularis]